ncbi:MAG TPA: hypothetical protein VFK13_11790 [Gemmatimonadaceae bacterium]|nr:hypothetical protein [Gemmatimonadaceae bacterium]
MDAPRIDPAAQLAQAAESYRAGGNIGQLLQSLDDIARNTDVESLRLAVEPYRDVPEIAGPIYERVVAACPDDARALVRLANAYWLSGRGPEVVGELASRAIAADPDDRAAWHLWALSESDLRARVARWKHITERFPADELARATYADNATSLAATEQDEQALAEAIRSYEMLLGTAEHQEQRTALTRAITTLKGWRL